MKCPLIISRKPEYDEFAETMAEILNWEFNKGPICTNDNGVFLDGNRDIYSVEKDAKGQWIIVCYNLKYPIAGALEYESTSDIRLKMASKSISEALSSPFDERKEHYGYFEPNDSIDMNNQNQIISDVLAEMRNKKIKKILQ
jgi:hypothetical protein